MSGGGVAQRWTPRSSPMDRGSDAFHDGQTSGITWAPALGMFVAVGQSANNATSVMTSATGLGWVSRDDPWKVGVNNGVGNDVTYAPTLGIYCMVGSSGDGSFQVMTSSDGIAWTAQSSALTGGAGAKIAWSEDQLLFVAAGFDDPTFALMTSPNGVVWTGQATPWDGDAPNIFGIAYSPTLGLWVAGGRDSSNDSILTSPDAITWTTQTNPLSGGSGSSVVGVCWSPTLNKFVAVGTVSFFSGGTMTSPDGVAWTLVPANSNPYFATIDAGGVVLVGGEDGALSSTIDGVNWKPNTTYYSPANGDSIYSFGYSPALNLAVMGGGTEETPSIETATMVPEPGNQFQCSPDWTAQVTPLDATLDFVEGICWSPELGLFCAVGEADGPGDGAIMTSPDGVTWTDQGNPWDTGIGGGGSGVCWAPTLGLFCAVGGSFDPASPKVATSPDGATWTVRTSPWDPGGQQMTYVAWSEDQLLFVAVGDPNGTFPVGTSPDGITWTARSTPWNGTSLFVVAYSPTLHLWVMGGRHRTGGGNIMGTSPDGVTWTAVTTPMDSTGFPGVFGLIWSDDDGVFYALAFNSSTPKILMSSSDGISWGLLTTPYDDNDNFTQAITSGNGWLVIGGNVEQPYALSQSFNSGATWLHSASPFDGFRNNVYALAYSPQLNLFVAGGNFNFGPGGPCIATNSFPDLTSAAPPSRFSESTAWRWIVADLEGATVTFLDPLAMNRAISYTLDDAAVATCDLPADNPEVNIVMNSEPFVSFNDKILYCLRREDITPCTPWKIRFAGLIQLLNDEITVDTDVATTHLTAYDPWKYLDSRPVVDQITLGLPGQGGVTYPVKLPDGTPVTPAYIAWSILVNTVAYSLATDPAMPFAAQQCYIDFASGHVPPNGDDTTPIDEAYNFSQGMTVGDAWRQLAQDGLCDIVLSPIYPMDPTVGAICRLDIHTLAGNQSNNIAAFSWDLPGRCLVGMNRLQDGTTMANHIELTSGSAGAPTPVQINTGSTGRYGPYWYWSSVTGKLAYPLLVQWLAAAQLQLSAQGVRTITVDPAPERAPIPLLDYHLGDQVPLYATNAFRLAINPTLDSAGDWEGLWRIITIPVTIPDDAPETVSQLMLSQPSGTIV